MKVHYSSKKNKWETPQDLFDSLNELYNFTLDPCAEKNTAKCEKYFTKRNNGLKKSWRGEIVFMNPPYGREIGKWVKKAYDEAMKGATVVCLLPSRTDTRWFHDYCLKGRVKFIKGRLKFSGAKMNAPFPNMLVFFHGPAMRIS